METLKKAWRLLASMHFAIFLLILLAAACAAGSLVTQGQTYMWYAQRYSERTAALIIALHLDDAFHSWWFILITAFLCLNLLLCNVLRAPQLIRRSRRWGGPPVPDPAPSYDASAVCASEEEARGLLGRLGMRNIRESGSGEKILYACKNRAGLWGAWVCHLGILLLIVGFTLGQMTKEEYTVYGVPGETKQVADTDYFVQIHDFRVERAADGFAEQYCSAVTLYYAPEGQAAEAVDAEASVNHPGSAFGFKLYQNSMGDAAKLTIRRDGESVQESWVCAGDSVPVLETPLSLRLQSVLWEEAEGERNPTGYAYMIYVGEEFYTMNVQGEGKTIPDFRPYEAQLSEAQSYTLLQLKRDRFTPRACAGGVVTMLGLLLAFYLQTRKLWALQNEDGTWTVCGSSPKGGALFADRVTEAAEQIKNES